MKKSAASALLITEIQKAVSLSFLDPVPNSVDDLPTRFRVKDHSCGGHQRQLPRPMGFLVNALFQYQFQKKILTALGFHDVCDGNEPHSIASVHLGKVKG
jgi:hypothetical protein